MMKKGAPTCMGSQPMEYVRTDWDTGKHLFRCPTGGCSLKETGTKGITHCDSHEWEDPRTNLKVIGIIPRSSPEWDMLYSMRMSIERTFGSLKHSRALEGHRVRGMHKIMLHATMSLLTYQATMRGHLQYEDVARLRDMSVRVA